MQTRRARLPAGTGDDAGRRRPGRTAVTAVTAALVLVGVGLVTTGEERTTLVPEVPGAPVGPETPQGPGVPTVVTGPWADAALIGEAVGPVPGAAGGLLLEPPPVRWELFVGVALPYSLTAGPRSADGPVVGGFAQSPEGALLAATHLGTRYLVTPGEGWREVLARQVLPGVGREVFGRARSEVVADDPPGTFGQVAGFRFVTWSPDVAVVQLVTRFPRSGSLRVTTSTVRWAGGDWRLELQPDGGTSPTAQRVADLDGFVVWGGL